MSELDGKVAVITGASKGIGKAISHRLADAGAKCVLVASDESRLRAALKDFDEGQKQRTSLVTADLSTASGCQMAADKILEREAAVDILINCAGATKAGSFPEQPDEDWVEGFDLKFFGSVRLCRHLWAALKDSSGTIINIGGGATYSPAPGFMVGGAVNAALAHFSKALSLQGLKDDVNVNIIHPGMTVSDRMVTLLEAQAREEGISVEDAKRNNVEAAGIRRLGQPEDVAEIVAFLCLPKARHIHGVGIAVDGGATAGFH